MTKTSSKGLNEGTAAIKQEAMRIRKSIENTRMLDFKLKVVSLLIDNFLILNTLLKLKTVIEKSDN